jgi:hypothetical protein
MKEEQIFIYLTLVIPMIALSEETKQKTRNDNRTPTALLAMPRVFHAMLA